MPIEQIIPECEPAEIGTRNTTDFEKRAAQLTDLLRDEISDEVERRLHTELLNEIAGEIAATEASVREKELEIATTMSTDDFNLGAVLKLKAEKQELDAYLRGLLFCAEKWAARRSSENPISKD